MNRQRWQQPIFRVGRTVQAVWKALWRLAIRTAEPSVLGLWNNPLFRREREARPLPIRVLSFWLPVAAGGMMLLPILAWAIDSRLMGAALLALNLGVALILALAAPVISAGLVPAARDEATFTSLSPVDGVWASPLIALWRLRWLIAAALALTPTLMIGVLHVNVAAFSAYHDSVIALGSAAPQEQVRLLLPGGAVPYFRLVLRAISAGLLPWAILPLAGMLGVTGVLLLDDVTLGQIAGLILTLIALLIGGITWNWLSLTPMFAQGLEIARTILVTGLLAGPTGLSAWIARQNTRWLLK